MSGTIENAARRPLNLGKLLTLVVPILFALGLGVSVASGLWSAASHEESTPAPRELAGYRLDQAMSGPEAIAEISELHGEDIAVKEAWVAHYRGSGTIWAARASGVPQAMRLLDGMVRGIQGGKSPFQGLRQLEVEGIAVYTVTDGRQQHFFYGKGDQVVWVAAPKGAESAFLSAALDQIGRIAE